MSGYLPLQLANQCSMVSDLLGLSSEQIQLGHIEDLSDALEVGGTRQSLAGFPVPNCLTTDAQPFRQSFERHAFAGA